MTWRGILAARARRVPHDWCGLARCTGIVAACTSLAMGCTAADGAGGTNDVGAMSGSTTTACIPGKVEACVCSDGAPGAQACRQDGAGFEPCGCKAGGALDAGTRGADAATGRVEVGDDASSRADLEGPTTGGAASGANDKHLGGAASDICPTTTAPMNVPWLSQKMANKSWGGNVCCGPAVASMVKAFRDGDSAPGDSDLAATVDYMDAKVSGWSAKNYSCTVTSNDQLVETLTNFVGVEATAVSVGWCGLVSYLDGQHIVIFIASSQGGNSGNVFNDDGEFHYLILDHVDGKFAYVNDPGRSYASQGEQRKFTLDSVRASYEKRGSSAVVVSLTGPCPNKPSGAISAPPNGSKVCNKFTVKGNVQDLDGLVRVTATIDTDENCKFSKEIAGNPSGSTAVEIEVLPDGACQLATGEHALALWTQDACGQKAIAAKQSFYYECVDACASKTCAPCQTCSSATGVAACIPDASQDGQACALGKVCNGGTCDSACVGGQCGTNCATCAFTTSPPIGGWTPDFTSNSNCNCSASNPSCHSLYVAKINSLNGNTASLTFAKTGGDGPSSPLHYWIVVADVATPSCQDLGTYVVRKEGTWSAGQPLTTSVNVWPDESSCKQDSPGVYKKMFIITDQQGLSDQKIWFQKTPLVFTRACK